MPSYGLPPVLYNVVCAFNERLPATARSTFQQILFQRLELIPHADQLRDDTSEELDMVPVLSGTGHLDAICRWFLLGMLVDPHFGVIELTEAAAEQTKVREIARLFCRWLEGDYPSEKEWEDLPSAEVEESMSMACRSAVWLQPLGGDGSTMVAPVIDMAACSGWDRRMKTPPGCPLVSPSLVGRGFDRGLNWLARKLGRAPETAAGTPAHYLWQATWLLDLLTLRWLPTDPQEEELFRRIVDGSVQELPEYVKILRKNKVELELARRMEGTLKRMDQMRRRTDRRS